MVDIVQTLTVSLPPERVFAFWGDHSNNPKWQKGQRRCTWTSPPPIGVGSTYDQEASMMGRAIVSSVECVEFTSNAWTTTASKNPTTIAR